MKILPKPDEGQTKLDAENHDATKSTANPVQSVVAEKPKPVIEFSLD